MKKLILIVGMDNTGKTTLADKLSKQYNVEKTNWDYSLYKNLTKEEYLNKFQDKMFKDDLVIFERFTPIEEQIYGNVLRGKSKFEFNDVKDILETYHPYIIYCRPDNKTILNWNDREQMEGVVEKSEKLIKGFDELMKDLLLLPNSVFIFDFYRYNYNDKGSYDFLITSLDKYIKGE